MSKCEDTRCPAFNRASSSTIWIQSRPFTAGEVCWHWHTPAVQALCSYFHRLPAVTSYKEHKSLCDDYLRNEIHWCRTFAVDHDNFVSTYSEDEPGFSIERTVRD